MNPIQLKKFVHPAEFTGLITHPTGTRSKKTSGAHVGLAPMTVTMSGCGFP